MRVITTLAVLLLVLVPTSQVSSVIGGINSDPLLPQGGASRVARTSNNGQQKIAEDRVREEAFKNPFDEAKLKAYFETLPKDGDRYIIEGDLLLTEQDLRVYVASKSAEVRPIIPGPELLLAMHEGAEDYYDNPAKRTLTFAIDRNSFPAGKNGWYQVVVKNMTAAAREWQSICASCRIRFVYSRTHDTAPTNDKVNFIVQYRDVGGKYIAAAFFPHTGPLDRYLYIDPSYFTTEYNKVGVIRHELGHVLGYRHEHTRSVPGCYFEDNEWRPLTPYDAQSVMHYFCGGGGGLSLTISRTDKAGHRKQYALPR